MVRMSCGALAEPASRAENTIPSLDSGYSSNATDPAAVTPDTGVDTRPVPIDPKLPTALEDVRAGRAFHVTPVSLQLVDVRHTAGPSTVGPLTARLNRAAAIDSPAANVGTVKRR